MWECMSHVRGGGDGETGCISACRDSGLNAPDIEGLVLCYCVTQCIYITKQHFEGQSTWTVRAGAFACWCTGARLRVMEHFSSSLRLTEPPLTVPSFPIFSPLFSPIHKAINQTRSESILSISIRNSLVQSFCFLSRWFILCADS